MTNTVIEAINKESDLILKLSPIPETDIFKFMENLEGGTSFNMGMYSDIKVSRAYKNTFRIYKVVEMSAIVSGIDYEKIQTTQDFRDQTGKAAGDSWYEHEKGFENKVGVKKTDPSSKYVLWNIKPNSGTNVKYYLVDIATGDVTPISKDGILQSNYLTDTEKKKLMPQPVIGYNLTTGEIVENKTIWRTAAFNHIFWLNQAGKSTMEYGVKFTEEFDGIETQNVGPEIFRDGNPTATDNLDALLAGPKSVEENSKLVDDEFFIDFE